jgi:hypothetical protein
MLFFQQMLFLEHKTPKKRFFSSFFWKIFDFFRCVENINKIIPEALYAA